MCVCACVQRSGAAREHRSGRSEREHRSGRLSREEAGTSSLEKPVIDAACVCVCVCARARACVCVCVCVGGMSACVRAFLLRSMYMRIMLFNKYIMPIAVSVALLFHSLTRPRSSIRTNIYITNIIIAQTIELYVRLVCRLVVALVDAPLVVDAEDGRVGRVDEGLQLLRDTRGGGRGYKKMGALAVSMKVCSS